jgi:alcohol oxidase
VYGNKGWGSEHLIPLLKKVRVLRSTSMVPTVTFLQAETYNSVSTNSTHGKSGPIKVSFAEQPLNISENFLSVAKKFDKDRGSLDDTNAFFSCDGYGVRKSRRPATSIIY